MVSHSVRGLRLTSYSSPVNSQIFPSNLRDRIAPYLTLVEAKDIAAKVVKLVHQNVCVSENTVGQSKKQVSFIHPIANLTDPYKLSEALIHLWSENSIATRKEISIAEAEKIAVEGQRTLHWQVVVIRWKDESRIKKSSRAKAGLKCGFKQPQRGIRKTMRMTRK